MKNRDNLVWAEMARRYIVFYNGNDWKTIESWGLFNWGEISHLLKSGLLKTKMVKENKTIWVTPSEKAYTKFIKPILDKFTNGEISRQELYLISPWNQ